MVKKRCSLREYSQKPIAKADLERIIDAGRLAPTARGEEPWEFLVFTDKKKIEEVAEITDHGKFLKGATAGIAVLCRDTKYYLEDGCAATENILLAATALGIGSCWIAGDKKEYAAKVLKALSVPQGYKLVSIISLGYPKGGFRPKKKRSLTEVLHSEEF